MNAASKALAVERVLSGRGTWTETTGCSTLGCKLPAIVMWEWGEELGTLDCDSGGPDREYGYRFACQTCLHSFGKWQRKEALFTRLADGREFWPGSTTSLEFLSHDDCTS
jgi:hypothetical protein